MSDVNDRQPVPVITAFVVRDDRVLLLRRSGKVGSYRGRWAGVSGYLEVEEPEEQARIELGEELGLAGPALTLERVGAPLPVTDAANRRAWLVHPFRFRLAPGAEPRLDWEHTELRWASPAAMGELDTVPGLWDAWQLVADGFGDSDGGSP